MSEVVVTPLGRLGPRRLRSAVEAALDDARVVLVNGARQSGKSASVRLLGEGLGASVSRGVLDTSVLIASDVQPLPGQLAISVISLAELRYGVLIAKSSDARAIRLARLTGLQKRFDPLPVDEAVADSYARIATRVVSSGRQPRSRVMDLLIAATAHAHTATLYTRNAADLRGLEDLIDIASV